MIYSVLSKDEKYVKDNWEYRISAAVRCFLSLTYCMWLPAFYEPDKRHILQKLFLETYIQGASIVPLTYIKRQGN